MADGIYPLRESVHLFFALGFHENFKFLLRAGILGHALTSVSALTVLKDILYTWFHFALKPDASILTFALRNSAERIHEYD